MFCCGLREINWDSRDTPGSRASTLGKAKAVKRWTGLPPLGAQKVKGDSNLWMDLP
jgi:hypothetical protein